MPKSKLQKDQEVKNLEEHFKAAKSAVFVSYDGLNVKDSHELRNILRQEGSSYIASKKTLLKKVLGQTGFNDVNVDEFVGSIGVAFGQEEEVAPARILSKFAKGRDYLKIQGGLLEGKFINAAKVKELALLPGKLELIALTVRTIQAPLSSFVNVLAGNLRGLVNVLNAVKENKNQ
ncbi:MAG: 50S ribosomal protein L10 [Patescibacteria group bacterium]|jgi:large subunit ribosomal protein L10